MSDRERFEQKGYQLVDDFLSPADCNQLLGEIQELRQHHKLPEIHRPMKERSLRYSVIDGDMIRDHLQSVWQLYRGPVKREINRLAGDRFETLENTRVGVNVNLMMPGRSEYRWHYDRTRLTAILYLNDVKCGETELYPNYRIVLKNAKRLRLQKFLDNCLRPSLIRRVSGKNVVVRPSAGRLVVMRGNRCWHSVRGVEGHIERISVVLAYDLPGTTFPMEEGLDSYLYTRQEPTTAQDPNYG